MNRLVEPKWAWRRNLRRVVAVGLFVFFSVRTSDLIFASELMSTADLMSAGAWRLSFYGLQAETEPELEISGTDAIQLPISGGGTSTVFSDSSKKIQLESEHSAAVAALTIRPRDGLHYRLKVGHVRDYRVSFSSGSQTNSLEALNDGITWGLGARWNITQDTPVSIATALDFQYNQTILTLDRFHSNGTNTAVSQRYEQEEIQAAINFSRRFTRFEPFGGLKVNRVKTKLKDKNTKEKLSGTVSGFIPFVGIGLDLFEKEMLILEASFMDEEMLSAGINISF